MSLKPKRRPIWLLIAALNIGAAIEDSIEGHTVGLALSAAAAAAATGAFFWGERQRLPTLGECFRDYAIAVAAAGSFYLTVVYLWGPDGLGIREVAGFLYFVLVLGIFVVIVAVAALIQAQRAGPP